MIRIKKITTLLIFCLMLLSNNSIASMPSTAELLEQLTNTSSRDFKVAVEWCGLLKVKEAVPSLENALENGKLRSPVKVEIIKTLGKIGDPHAIGILLRCLPNAHAVSALNRIDRQWRFREETINYYTRRLDDFYKNTTDECLRQDMNLEALLMMDYDEQRVKKLCLEILEQKNKSLAYIAVKKVMELKAYEAIEPLLALLAELPRNIDGYLFALDTLAPEWRRSERGKVIGESIFREFKERKAEFDKHILKPEDIDEYVKYKKREGTGFFTPYHLREILYCYKGSYELINILETIKKTRVSSAIPLLLEILKDEREILYLRCKAAETLAEIIEPEETQILAKLSEYASQTEPFLGLASLRALKRFGERFPERAFPIPETDKIAKKFELMLKNPDEDELSLSLF